MKNVSKNLKNRLFNLALIPAIAYSSTSNYVYANEIDDITISISDSNKIIEDRVRDIINSNYRLTTDEKEFLYSSSIILLENSEYIDFDQVDNFLLRTDVSFESYDEFIQGRYYGGSQKIELMFDSLNEAAKPVYLHEILHGYSLIPNKSASYLEEIYNEICTKEYCDELGIAPSVCGYDNDLVVGYILEELLGVEPIRNYKFKGDNDIIIDALLNIGALEEDITRFFNDLSTLSSFAIYGVDDIALKSKTHVSILECLDAFHIAKFGYAIYDNIELLSLMLNTNLHTSLIQEKIEEYIENSKYYNSEYSFNLNNDKFYTSSFDVTHKELFNNTNVVNENTYKYKDNAVIIDNDLDVDSEFSKFENKFTEALLNNGNIYDAEKYVIENTINFIHNNFEKFDKEYILDTVANLDIVFGDYGESFFIEEDKTLYYNNDGSDVLSSEFYSEIIQLYINKENSYNDYIYDIANNIFTLDYSKNTMLFSDKSNDFTLDAHIAYFVYELLGEEFLYNYKFNPDKEVLHDHLINCGYEEREVLKLISIFDEFRTVKMSDNYENEIGAYIYKLYNFISSHNLIGSINVIRESAELKTRKCIETNYIIDNNNETVVYNQDINLESNVNFFNEYKTGENYIFDTDYYVRSRK